MNLARPIFIPLTLLALSGCVGLDERDADLDEDDRAVEDGRRKVVHPVFDRVGTAALRPPLAFETPCAAGLGVKGKVRLHYTMDAPTHELQIQRLTVDDAVTQIPSNAHLAAVKRVRVQVGGHVQDFDGHWTEGGVVDLSAVPSMTWGSETPLAVDVFVDTGNSPNGQRCTSTLEFRFEQADRVVEQVVVDARGIRARTLPVLDQADGILYDEASAFRATIAPPVSDGDRLAAFTSVLGEGTDGEVLYEWVPDTEGGIFERRTTHSSTTSWAKTSRFDSVPGGVSGITAMSTTLAGSELIVAIWKGQTGYRATFTRDATTADGIVWNGSATWNTLSAAGLPTGGDPQAGGGLVTQQGVVIPSSAAFTWSGDRCQGRTAYGTFLQAWWREGAGAEARGYRRGVLVDANGDPDFDCIDDTTSMGNPPQGLAGQSMHPLAALAFSSPERTVDVPDVKAELHIEPFEVQAMCNEQMAPYGWSCGNSPAGLVVKSALGALLGSANPDTPLDFTDGDDWATWVASKEYRGYQHVSDWTLGCKAGQVDDVVLPGGYFPLSEFSYGYTRGLLGAWFAESDVFADSPDYNGREQRTTDDGHCVEFVDRRASRIAHAERVAVWRLLGYDQPFVWNELRVRACCDGTVQVRGEHSSFPEGRLFIDGEWVDTDEGQKLGQFMQEAGPDFEPDGHGILASPSSEQLLWRSWDQ
ncbi:MAG: hypothetical protein K0V04_06860 [Deltaproteobacteria bacterium]|nr:hypothetical protein [Deltaproteobacteria bacterium]